MVAESLTGAVIGLGANIVGGALDRGREAARDQYDRMQDLTRTAANIYTLADLTEPDSEPQKLLELTLTELGALVCSYEKPEFTELYCEFRSAIGKRS